MLVSFFKLWLMIYRLVNLRTEMLPLATLQSSLMRKGVHRGMGVLTILPINPTYIIQNIALLRKTNNFPSLLSYY